MKYLKIAVISMMSLSISFAVHAGNQQENAGKHLVLNLVGSGEMYESTVPDIDGDGNEDSAMCFDVQLIDVHTNQVIGKGTDCLAMVAPTGAGVALVGTTYFHLPGGALITRGKTSVQPVSISSNRNTARRGGYAYYRCIE